MNERRFSTALPVDLKQTLQPLALGAGDPCVRFEARAVTRAFHTPAGPATLRFCQEDQQIHVSAFGPGIEYALEYAPEMVGARDSLDGFRPSGLIQQLHRRLPGLRLGRSHAVFHAALIAILGQKVSGREAFLAYRRICLGMGSAAPGPFQLRLPPEADAIAACTYWQFHELGVERRRAETLIRTARAAARLEELLAPAPGDARARLLTIRGIGVWTAAEIARVALGDADAISEGDYHLPNLVAYNLCGEARADDARMLELVAAYAGHRGRVQRLLEVGGRHAPRFGARRPTRDFRGF